MYIMPHNQDTKERILHTAVDLFARKSYDKVSLREIAGAVGITEAAIYRHYTSKDEILTNILNEFKRRLKSYLLTKSQVDRYIETDTPHRLLERCVGCFTEEAPYLFRLYRIVFMESLTNQTASGLILSALHTDTAESIRYMLGKLIECGKIPAFDTQFLSMLWAQSMFSGAVVWMNNISAAGRYSCLSYNTTPLMTALWKWQ